eukprot:2777279-Rhodomonas_salina.1
MRGEETRAPSHVTLGGHALGLQPAQGHGPGHEAGEGGGRGHEGRGAALACYAAAPPPDTLAQYRTGRSALVVRLALVAALYRACGFISSTHYLVLSECIPSYPHFHSISRLIHTAELSLLTHNPYRTCLSPPEASARQHPPSLRGAQPDQGA